MASQQTSAAGVLSLLNEPEEQLQLYSLKQLSGLVENFWPEISYALPRLEELWEDSSFGGRKESALLASKVFFHLGEYQQSILFAMRAGDQFDVTQSSHYTKTILSEAIQAYVGIRANKKEGEVLTEGDLTPLVNRLFENSFQREEFHEALGIALESRRLDMVVRTLTLSPELLPYCVHTARTLLKNREWRREVLNCVADIYSSQSPPSFAELFDVLVTLDDSERAASALAGLLESGDHITAYQLCFDLCTSSSQRFLSSVRTFLKSEGAPFEQCREILTGEPLVDLNLRFLYWNDATDLKVLERIKESVSTRDTVNHAAAIFANALMHAGTTKDTFLRTNMEWLARATHWARFSAAAGMGVIHKGHLKDGKTLLSPYLPNPASATRSAYSEGGALFGLGLVHANHGSAVQGYLREQLFAANDPVAQHGGCLGLGLAAMGTNDLELVEDIKSRILYNDDAVAGEAAGIAMGLVLLGSGMAEATEEMLTYAAQTSHEKIIRGLATGVSLVYSGTEEGCDLVVQQMLDSSDQILRYGACYTLGLAYAGTANNVALQKLLHIAVSDTSDDVRRAATINIGFVLCNKPDQVPTLLSLLSHSYNSYVRYGAAIAVGVACAGTSLAPAIALLEPLLEDPVAYVRQGAMMGLSMVLIQSPDTEKEASLRRHLMRNITTKHVPVMARFGAIISQGLLDAGGRNVTLSLRNDTGAPNMTRVVGLSLFTHHWFWHPMIHFVSLAFTPTAVIGVDAQLRIPEWKLNVDAPPSRFAYPEAMKEESKAAKEKVAAAVLSVSHKAQRRAKEEADPEVEKKKKQEEEEQAAKAKEQAEKDAVPEVQFELKSNPARITPTQLQFCTFEGGERYTALRKGRLGVVLLRDNKPGEEVVLVTKSAPGSEAGAGGAAPGATEEEDEPEPPKPFTIDE